MTGFAKAEPVIYSMSRINNNGKSKTAKQKTKAKKAFGEQTMALTHRERPYMHLISLHVIFIHCGQ
ncbi:hypothetical protein [Shewanella denitrificans]|jgi:hypothetical protein|uniref:hypothetical protein n=1 Tax=Shewanella denitrificans TaxID=192073 RepID=UPI0002D5CC1A|nr:hypothetical protein [Shewanella denitrificans]